MLSVMRKYFRVPLVFFLNCCWNFYSCFPDWRNELGLNIFSYILSL